VAEYLDKETGIWVLKRKGTRTQLLVLLGCYVMAGTTNNCQGVLAEKVSPPLVILRMEFWCILP